MPDFVVRPSMKLVRPIYWTFFLLTLGTLIYLQNEHGDNWHSWRPALLVAPAMLLIWAIYRHVKQHFVVLSVTGDKLRYECGWLSRSTRTIQISKVQDVRVDQTLLQRLLKIGSLSIETAGETSRLTVENIDYPQAVADQIIDASQSEGEKRDKKKG